MYIKCTQEEVREFQNQEKWVLRGLVAHERVEEVAEVAIITCFSVYFKVFDLIKIRENM